ncbi:hypothetical protein MFIFM68171_06634 [Madurella fahalii]|uniref:Uncharacterized protein n=1 Tax=Madurella fahalii TaxID=1157608 RepID=A0ABQ0GFI1_9PEZI
MVPVTATNTDEAKPANSFSISQLMSKYPHERLFVHPLMWTARHISLLGCEFFHDGVITIAPLPSPQPEQPGIDVLPAPATRPLLLVVCRRTTMAHPPPVSQLVYVDPSDIARHRRIKLGPSLHGNIHRPPNVPGLSRFQKQLRRLTPHDPREDPYIAALLIALAQEQRLPDEGGGGNHNDMNLFSCATNAARSQLLLVTRPGDTTWLHIYTTKVSPEFLERIDWPFPPPPADARSRPWMSICRRRLAFKRYKTLPRRLTAVLRDAGLATEMVPEK